MKVELGLPDVKMAIMQYVRAKFPDYKVINVTLVDASVNGRDAWGFPVSDRVEFSVQMKEKERDE